MNRSFRVLVVALIVCSFVGVVRAEGERREGEVRGTFVKLVERKVGQGWSLGVVVEQFEKKGEAVLLIPRNNRDLLAAARKLTRGQKVELGFVSEGEQMWVKRLEAAKTAESGRRTGGEIAELRELVRKMQQRLAQMERQVVELRQENARLKRKLAGKEGKRADKDDDGFPAGMRGFRGMLVGTVAKKLDRGFVLKVEKVAREWKASKAPRSADAVGKMLAMVAGDGRMAERHLKIARELKVGDRVSAEGFHYEGNRLTLVEELRKVD